MRGTRKAMIVTKAPACSASDTIKMWFCAIEEGATEEAITDHSAYAHTSRMQSEIWPLCTGTSPKLNTQGVDFGHQLRHLSGDNRMGEEEKCAGLDSRQSSVYLRRGTFHGAYVALWTMRVSQRIPKTATLMRHNCSKAACFQYSTKQGKEKFATKSQSDQTARKRAIHPRLPRLPTRASSWRLPSGYSAHTDSRTRWLEVRVRSTVPGHL